MGNSKLKLNWQNGLAYWEGDQGVYDAGNHPLLNQGKDEICSNDDFKGTPEEEAVKF